ncbi:hypothetical protein [Cylindrospermopsis raciborskii]|uniref:Uncharacterized protein n=1 Tax=Cylindrospermopsis raciborskii CENA302 TaxID=1170768 RepID=A0A9Q5QVW3_9CYAN|nr:hypothetical protein [Cylindrospermopsis raciborskii]MCZ2202652.1 hypothetical protein [Cylindrospermopsis raciborskii PAMP2012]MCZ2206671.1 hypothetical protein [Cylindrospermopsis raciborskii PAMP2011]NLQ04529.1 hypothetical protein [Cylindrospermopsis raciborskii MVCC19]OHY34871.1 hypothetical protein BCV64_04410 [Cylindrospermopsis raciborskii MVCC14]OPH09246.1 hypothetical protein CENA302_11355 [Cylindrospermopsis raciborskii CENA302]
MFGFIKNLIAGILSFISGIFGKKDEYYLELKEENEPTTVAPVVKVESVVTPKVESIPAPVVKPVEKPVVAKETTFAPQYLLTLTSRSRRRPGANMSSFLDMARQAKVPT